MRRASDQSGASLRPPSIVDEEPSVSGSRGSSRNASRTSLHAASSSPMTPLTSTTSNSGSGHGHGGPGTASKRQSMLVVDDDGEDSDAEDSETPWTCVLHIYPAHLSPLTEAEAKERERASSISHSPSQSSSTGGSPPPLASPDGRLRLRLAVLVPTPHHPKIIGQFKVPFPLPDVAITPRAPIIPTHSASQPSTAVHPVRTGRYDPRSAGVGARFLPRKIGPDGVMRSTVKGGNGNGEEINVAQEVLLTAEDIKDVLSSTGLWLVVRESFAGLGRTKRKGDGWRIRA